jgi:hypothetical protein
MPRKHREEGEMLDKEVVPHITSWIENFSKEPVLDIEEQLQIIKKENYNPRIDMNAITVGTDEIIIEGINFGEFDVSILTHQSSFYINQIIRYKALTPVYPSRKYVGDFPPRYVHPHVHESGSACWGQLNNVVHFQLETGNLVDVVASSRDFLNNHTLGHAPVPLQFWDSVRAPCEDCGTRLLPKEIKVCEECREVFCNSCIRRCANCKVYVCNLCSTLVNNGSGSQIKLPFCSECLERIERYSRQEK